MNKYKAQIAVVLAIVLLGGAWVLLQRDSLSPAQDAVWKTYTSKELGYEIQYPSNWKITEYPDEGKNGSVYVTVEFSAPTNSKSPNMYDPTMNYSYLSLHVSSHSGSTDLKRTFGATSYDQDIMISGVPAIRRGPVPTPIAGDGLPVEQMPTVPSFLRSTIEMIYDGKMYSLIGESTGPDYVASQKVLDQILSTFRLLK